MKIYFSLFLLILLSLILPKSALANTLFVDNFNGNGELNSYNNLYKIVSDFHPNTGTFSLVSDHLETTGFDPGYIYEGVSQDNTCASIDFNWTEGNLTGHWTHIILHSTKDTFGISFEIRNDDPTHHRWVVYEHYIVYGEGAIDLDESKTHNMKACVSGTDIYGYLDNAFLFKVNAPGHTGGYMGFASQSPTNYLDNFTIETFLVPSLTLSVPLIKQIDPLWKNKLYDSANVWSPNDTGIGSWGCALTSAAMVFQYHKITKMPNNQTLNPETLNAWLKNEPDGYVNTGWVNWLALSRLSKKAKSKNPDFIYDALEYKRYSGENKIQLTSDINNNIPDILEEPGHFIVAKGIEDNTFLINDPFYTRTQLTEYNNTFKSLGRYTPSNTDLSYFLFSVDKDTTISVKDSNGNTIGETFIQSPITNANNVSKQNGSPFMMFLADKPDSGNYTVSISSDKTHIYSFTSYLYDINGEVITHSYSGTTGKGVDTLSLQFNKNNNKLIIFKQKVTYDSVITDIRELQAQNLIISQIADSLVLLINRAKNPLSLSSKIVSLANLHSFKQTISLFKGKGINNQAYDILLSDINSLISSL